LTFDPSPATQHLSRSPSFLSRTKESAVRPTARKKVILEEEEKEEGEEEVEEEKEGEGEGEEEEEKRRRKRNMRNRRKRRKSHVMS